MRRLLIFISPVIIFLACKKSDGGAEFASPRFEADIEGVHWKADSVYAERVPPYGPVGYFAISAKRNDNSYLFLQTFNDTVSTQTFKEASAVVVSFQAKLAVPDSNYINVSWVTLSEANTNRFEIEHSYDGMQFYYVGQVAAQGNSAKEHSYSFSEKPALTDPFFTKVYYRLKLVDSDSTVAYSAIIIVRFGTPGLYIFPSGDFGFGYNGTITVTSVDRQKNLLSGNFHFTYTDDSDHQRKKVENGVFENVPYQ
ncbi:MAG TPA: DUF6252 family protein [Parafilimonas sp.]|nr:DUF6252 family protein [Parafilimonas sp.]